MFDAAKVKEELIQWIRNWFDNNGKDCKAVVGISGGKDSTICAALCVEALGKDRVVGVLMPNGIQPDIDDSKRLVEHLGIKYYVINIHDAVEGVLNQMRTVTDLEPTPQTIQNLPPRIRMSTLYAISQSVNGRVINTCNRSEDYVGYSTRYGDSAGDVSILGNLLVCQVKEIGKLLNIPLDLVEKAPSDGLCGKTDEDNLGFTYATLDHYVLTGECEDPAIKAIIDRKHELNLFKLRMMDIAEFEGFEP